MVFWRGVTNVVATGVGHWLLLRTTYAMSIDYTFKGANWKILP